MAPVLQKILHVPVDLLNRYTKLNRRNAYPINIVHIEALFKYCSTEMQYLQYLGEMEPKIRMQYFMEPLLVPQRKCVGNTIFFVMWAGPFAL